MEIKAPFLDVASFTAEETTSDPQAPHVPLSSPFLSAYQEEEVGEVTSPETDEYFVFLNELYDEELDETLFELVNEATALYETHFSDDPRDPQTIGYEAERLLEQHFAPLVTETELMFEKLATEFSQHNLANLTEREIGEIIDHYQPSTDLSPNFDEFTRRIRSRARRVAGRVADRARRGASAAVRAGAASVLRRLQPLVKPLLKRVIEVAIGRLPSHLQPIARDLAKRLPLLQEVGAADDGSLEISETCEIAQIQYEFNQRVANLVFAQTEVEQELELAQVLTAPPSPNSYPIAELDRARTKFIQQLQELEDGGDPEPYIEEFVPALLPALRLGIRVAGRSRVIEFLSKFVARLIQRFVGPQHTPALSKAIVDAGLRLLQLEAPPEDQAYLAASTVAATVEDTIREVADLPDYVLDNQELLEGFVLQAFEKSAAANLPPNVLPERVYRKRPELAEAKRLGGTWRMKPHGSYKRYKKYSGGIPTKLTPHKVAAIELFGEIPLEEFLEEEYGIDPGESIDAVAHLYETMAGTHMADIAWLERNTPGLGNLESYKLLHPLTPEAAGLLFGEPDLGREVDPLYLADLHTSQVGQRFYYLEIPGKRPLMALSLRGRTTIRRPTQTRVTLDFPKQQIKVYLFLSEVQAQAIAVKLRQRAHIGAAIAHLQRFIGRGLCKILTGESKRIKLIHEAVLPSQWSQALQRLPSIVTRQLCRRLQQWMNQGFAQYLRKNPADFIKAAEDPADGVTLTFTISSPPGLNQLRQAIKGKGLPLAGLTMPEGAPTVTVKATPGHSHE